MTRYTAFLRAINVGGRSVKMEALRAYFEALGLAKVQTYIQSGNVIFESKEETPAALEKMIAAKLEAELGYPVPVFLRTGPELDRISRLWPFDEPPKPDHVLYVSFLAAPPEPSAARAVVELADGVMTFYAAGHEVYWLRDKSRGESKITNGDIEKMLGLAATRRNINTVRKIVEKYF